MKNILLFILLNTLFSCEIYSQYCNNDSISYSKIRSEIDSLVIKQDSYLWNSKFLSYLTDSTIHETECQILNFALIFDAFVSKGVILKGRLPQPNPRNNWYSADPVENAQFRNRYKDDRYIFDTYVLFVNIKQQYERQFANQYQTPEFQEMVKKVLSYCPLSNPKIVFDMIHYKYRHINIEKYYNDMRYYHTHK